MPEPDESLWNGESRKPVCFILKLSGTLSIFVFVPFESRSLDDLFIDGLQPLAAFLLQTLTPEGASIFSEVTC